MAVDWWIFPSGPYARRFFCPEKQLRSLIVQTGKRRFFPHPVIRGTKDRISGFRSDPDDCCRIHAHSLV